MTTRSSAKLLGSALLSSAFALGLATVSLWPGSARGDVVFDFSGTCSSRCTGTATGVLTLTNAYTYGTGMTPADFVSFSYTSSDKSFDITSDSLLVLEGGLNSDGSIARDLIIQSSGIQRFATVEGGFIAGITRPPVEIPDTGDSFTFNNVTPIVPEPSTWAMMLFGFLGLGFVGYRSVVETGQAKPTLSA